ncbi:MAG TPA: alpha/beta fold hydrolase [Anaerolineae bacterium]|nr:alpha/beta fold hydrolase [Anaerolineae bacterium]
MDISTFQDLYPFKSHWLAIDGHRLHYLDEGPRDAPPLLMLHGNPTWSFYYRTLIPSLSQSHRVIVPDHLGCGLSDKPQQYPYCLARHIANVECLVEQLHLKDITLVLHDWGGVIGMGYATRQPENVRRFVIFNTAAFVLPLIPKRIKLCRVPYLGEVLVRGLNLFAGLAVYMASGHPRRMSPQIRAGYKAPYDNWANRLAILRFVRDIPLEANHPTRPLLVDIDHGLAQFKSHPMLILWGGQDFCFTERDFFAEWKRRFPQAETHVFPDAGHYVVEDAHERIVPLVLKFLSS